MKSDMIESLFLDADKLPSLLTNYHPRPSQIRAASLIARSFEQFTNIVLEAPTGSGKTMAYLVPTFLSSSRVIISTKTKQLMAQLYQKDIPVMRSLFGERKVVILKGRKNYFCPHRFRRWIYPNAAFYKDVIEWYESTEESVLELPRGYFDAAALDKMSADSKQCLFAKCAYYALCPFNIAKQRADEASVVITNHHLLLADVARKASEEHGAIFAPADHIVFDEAHSLADIYSLFAGVELSSRRLVSLLSDHKSKIPFEELWKLTTAEESLQKSVSDGGGKVHYEQIKDKMAAFMDICRELVEQADDADLRMEFDHWDTAFAFINSEEDGLKIAEQRGRDLSVRYIPLNIANTFMTGVGNIAISSAFISATLTTSGSFDYFLREMGLENTALTKAVLPPVFQTGRQAKLFVPRLGSERRDGMMLELVRSVEGSVLIISNSILRMKYLLKYMSENQEEKAVFSQHDGDWSTFTSMDNIVLIGCAALREGLDLAGGDFNCVIIDKLPFEYPHDLYISYRAKETEERLGNSFIHFNLPRAVLYFKQACGRLIRHESDRGIWAVFDERILTKSYGKYFLDVLDNVTVTASLSEALDFLSGCR